MIGHAPAVLRPGDPVVLYARVSTPRQERAGHLGRQMAHLRRCAAEAGLTIVAEVQVVCPGWHHRRFGRAGYLAWKHDASILAHTTDRLIRPRQWWPAQSALPTQYDLHWMTSLVPYGVRLVTVIHPDADAKTIRSAHTLRGQALSGRRGGRPRSAAGAKKRLRDRLLPLARALRFAGNGVRAIAREIGVPAATVSDWLRGCTDFVPANPRAPPPKPD